VKAVKADKFDAAAALPKDFRLVLLHGPDGAAVSDLADKLVTRLGEGAAPTSMTAGDLKADPARLADEAAAVSMFGDKRVIRVDGAGDECIDAVQLLLSGPLGDPVVMTAGHLKRSKLLDLAEADPTVVVVVAWEADARDFARLAMELCSEHGLDATRDASARLADAASGDRLVLLREVEKLALYLDATPEQRQRLTPEHLAAVGAGISDDDIQPLVEAVAGGRTGEADAALQNLATLGISGIPLLRAVHRRLALLIDLRMAVDAGVSPRGAVDSARPPVFWKEKDAVAAQLGKWRTPGLIRAAERLLETERALKERGSAGEVLAAQALLAITVQAAR
jgi:DNA polymerase III subunit delta